MLYPLSYEGLLVSAQVRRYLARCAFGLHDS